MSSRRRHDRSRQEEGSGRASAAGRPQELCDPGAETAVQRRSRGGQGQTGLPEWAGESRGATQVFTSLLDSRRWTHYVPCGITKFPLTKTLLFPPRRKHYEESMMVRLNMPKHQKNARKRSMMSMSGQLSGITHFSDITALTGGEGGQVSLQWHH